MNWRGSARGFVARRGEGRSKPRRYRKRGTIAWVRRLRVVRIALCMGALKGRPYKGDWSR